MNGTVICWLWSQSHYSLPHILLGSVRAAMIFMSLPKKNVEVAPETTPLLSVYSK